MTPRIRGVLAPVLTPFDAQGRPDAERYLAHCRWLLDQGAGLAIFGTNSEANSLSVDERIDLADALFAAGLPAARMMPGTGACSVVEAVRLTRHMVGRGVAGALMLPPFYYKPVTDDGLFAYYAEVIEQVGDARLRIYLYHIPQLTGVPITLNLIDQLRRRYPDTVVGAKDSSGDWSNTLAMIERFAGDGFDVFPASESTLSRALPLGAAGCISATVNMNPGGIHAVYRDWQTPQGPQLQARADAIRQIFQALPMIPAMKRVLAEHRGDTGWRQVRAPLVPLSESLARQALAQLDAVGFTMPGLTRR